MSVPPEILKGPNPAIPRGSGLVEWLKAPERRKEIRDQGIVVAQSNFEASHIGCEIPGTSIGKFPDDLSAIVRRLKGSSDWTALEGLKVLDLASGSGDSGYYPHFSRLCAINGADVVAVDILPQSGLDREMFDWAQADLVEVVNNGGLGRLPILSGRKNDIIYSSRFVGDNPSPKLLRNLEGKKITLDTFEKMLQLQAGELLAEGGIMDLGLLDAANNNIRHTKSGHSLDRLSW